MSTRHITRSREDRKPSYLCNAEITQFLLPSSVKEGSLWWCWNVVALLLFLMKMKMMWHNSTVEVLARAGQASTRQFPLDCSGTKVFGRYNATQHIQFSQSKEHMWIPPLCYIAVGKKLVSHVSKHLHWALSRRIFLAKKCPTMQKQCNKVRI